MSKCFCVRCQRGHRFGSSPPLLVKTSSIPLLSTGGSFASLPPARPTVASTSGRTPHDYRHSRELYLKLVACSRSSPSPCTSSSPTLTRTFPLNLLETFVFRFFATFIPDILARAVKEETIILAASGASYVRGKAGGTSRTKILAGVLCLIALVSGVLVPTIEAATTVANKFH